jgi:hypothetical protein
MSLARILRTAAINLLQWLATVGWSGALNRIQDSYPRVCRVFIMDKKIQRQSTFNNFPTIRRSTAAHACMGSETTLNLECAFSLSGFRTWHLSAIGPSSPSPLLSEISCYSLLATTI